jgi:hypothetical protein
VTYDDVIVLLARQRSGTNAIRSVLKQDPELECMPEVFSVYGTESRDAAKRAMNYFTFLQRYAAGDPRRTFPDHHEELFLAYLDYLRGFAEKRYVLVDVKSTATQFFTAPWSRNITVPLLLDLIVKYELRVLNITRRNYLRYFVSNAKALDDGRFHVWETRQNGHSDTLITIEIPWLLRHLEDCEETDRIIADHFASYPNFRSHEYADIFEPEGKLTKAFLTDIKDWLQIGGLFREEPATKKSSYLPLPATIANYEEVAAALRGTKFEYCLEDEPAYRT